MYTKQMSFCFRAQTKTETALEICTILRFGVFFLLADGAYISSFGLENWHLTTPGLLPWQFPVIDGGIYIVFTK